MSAYTVMSAFTMRYQKLTSSTLVTWQIKQSEVKEEKKTLLAAQSSITIKDFIALVYFVQKTKCKNVDLGFYRLLLDYIL